MSVTVRRRMTFERGRSVMDQLSQRFDSHSSVSRSLVSSNLYADVESLRLRVHEAHPACRIHYHSGHMPRHWMSLVPIIEEARAKM